MLRKGWGYLHHIRTDEILLLQGNHDGAWGTDSNCIAYVNSDDILILGHAENSKPTEVRSPSYLRLKCAGETANASRYTISFNKSGEQAFLRPGEDGYTNLGGIDYHFRNVYATNGTILTSDRNRKRDINPVSDKYIEIMDMLQPSLYGLLTGDRTHAGYIAQDLEEVLKELGLTSGDFACLCRDIGENGEEIYGLRYQEFIPLLHARQNREILRNRQNHEFTNERIDMLSKLFDQLNENINRIAQ